MGGRAPRGANGERRDDRAGTLGALLYADTTRGRVPESEWVALVRATAAGDQRALHELYQRTQRIVFTLALRISGSRETAEELTVDTFHGVWQRAGRYDPAAGTVVGWIMNLARSRAIDRVRFEQRKKRAKPLAHDLEGAADAADGSELLELTSMRGALDHALTRLTPAERQAIETAFFSDMSYTQVAARLRQPVGTVKTRIRSGLGKLRQALGRGDGEA